MRGTTHRSTVPSDRILVVIFGRLARCAAKKDCFAASLTVRLGINKYRAVVPLLEGVEEVEDTLETVREQGTTAVDIDVTHSVLPPWIVIQALVVATELVTHPELDPGAFVLAEIVLVFGLVVEGLRLVGSSEWGSSVVFGESSSFGP